MKRSSHVQPEFESVPVRDLRVGDRVAHVGMHLEVRTEPQKSGAWFRDLHGGWYSVETEVLNLDAIVETAMYPKRWVQNGFTLSGNDNGPVARIIA